MLAHDKDVDIYFQQNAWADTEFSVKWATDTLHKAVSNLDEFVLFCDNLAAQISEPFKEKIRELNGIVWYGLANATNVWQPVDCGYGQLYKAQISIAQEEWLEDDDNVELWLGNGDKKLTASDRRVLISHWLGEAHRKIVNTVYDRVRYRSFEKTGCLITADGSEDSKIQPEGLGKYLVPPSSIIASPEDPIDIVVEPAEPEEDAQPEDEVEIAYTADGEEIVYEDEFTAYNSTVLQLLMYDEEFEMDIVRDE